MSILDNPAESVPIPPFQPEGIIGVRLPEGTVPARIVVVRLHAFGDAVITLPVLMGLRTAYPSARIEFITSDPYADLFESIEGIDRVWRLTASRSKSRRGMGIAALAIRVGSPELLIDLQRSRPAILLRQLLHPRAWVSFDRFAPDAAIERYLDATRWVGLAEMALCYGGITKSGVRQRAFDLLEQHGYTPDSQSRSPLICLNPAGGWATKRWPTESYIELGQMMIKRWGARIVLLGTGHVRRAGTEIARALNGNTIDLIDKTPVAEARAIVSELQLMVSDDSGLMHLAWTSGVPTVAMFGATRSTWSRPYGPASHCFISEDLECGACMSRSVDAVICSA